MTMTVSTTSSGALARLEVGGLSLIQYPATEFEAGPANLWLHLHDAAHPLTGPASHSSTSHTSGITVVNGTIEGVHHSNWLIPSTDGQVLGWHWSLTNITSTPIELGIICTLDMALAPLEDVRRNEFYVSQYLDLTPVEWDGGVALAVRQNMPGTRQPWCALASSEPVASWCTDALQLVDRSAGPGMNLSRGLPGTRLQHEHTLAGLQTTTMTLAPGTCRHGVFWIIPVLDHPRATGPEDAIVIAQAATSTWQQVDADADHPSPAVATVFSPARYAEVLPVDPPDGIAMVESSPEGAFWSGFSAGRLVVSAGKERHVLRPHGSILHFAPDAHSAANHLADTVWMRGCFNSQLTLGPASAVQRLSIRRSYLGLVEACGLRLLVRSPGQQWTLLDLPSLWQVDERSASWTYRLGGPLHGSTVQVDVTLPTNQRMSLHARVFGKPLDIMAVLFENNGGPELNVHGAKVNDDSPLFADGRSRGTSTRTVTSTNGTLILDAVIPAVFPEVTQAHHWHIPQLTGNQSANLLSRFLSNVAKDAAVHYQTPRGLEQHTGGAWGTRDVCQGPAGLLIGRSARDAPQGLRRAAGRRFVASMVPFPA